MPARASTHTADSLDAPVRLVPARLWTGFAALALVVAGAVLWSVLATLPQHVSASGVILHGASAITVRATTAGSLASVVVTPGTTVQRGQPLATFRAGKRQLLVGSPVDGTVVGVPATPGQALLPGAPLVAIDPATASARAILLVRSPREASRLAAGQTVELAGSTAGARLRGRVSVVAPYPSSADDVAARLGTRDVPGLASDGKPTWLVDVALDARGAAALPALTPVSASVLVERIRPHRLVFGDLR
jgi:biotin carboxyl carrier protein